jgi:hypothetical protein
MMAGQGCGRSSSPPLLMRKNPTADQKQAAVMMRVRLAARGV